MLLPDINVWLALAFDSHIHHPIAKQWFDALHEQQCLFCRVTQQGFLRLATNSKVFGTHALTMADAWQKYDLLQSDPYVSFADEPEGLETYWRGFTQLQSPSTNVWTDAYLASFAAATKWVLVSFDKGTARYAGVHCTILG